MNKTSITLLAILTICSIGLTTNSVFAETDLPPLVLKSPESRSETIQSEYYVYYIEKSQFLATDDSGETPSIICSIDNDSKPVNGNADQYMYNYGDINQLSGDIANYSRYTAISTAYWILPAGEHEVFCEIEDNTGNIVELTHSVALISDDLAPRWIKTISGWYTNSYIDTETYLKVIKYFHTAGVIEFDIENDQSVSDSSRIPSSFKSNTKNWVSDAWTNTQYKNTLENMADKGIFDNVNLGF